MIRRRRGLSLDVVAGLAGISKSYLGMLEHGKRGFNRRGLLDDLAAALGCSVVDLTGQPLGKTGPVKPMTTLVMLRSWPVILGKATCCSSISARSMSPRRASTSLWS